jgi:hypothetical protein
MRGFRSPSHSPPQGPFRQGFGGDEPRDHRVRHVRLLSVWRPSAGAGIPDGPRWGARHCGAPGMALEACSVGPSASGHPSARGLSPMHPQGPGRPHPCGLRPGWAAWAGVCPEGLHGLCSGPAQPARHPPAALLGPSSPSRRPQLGSSPSYTSRSSITGANASYLARRASRVRVSKVVSIQGRYPPTSSPACLPPLRNVPAILRQALSLDGAMTKAPQGGEKVSRIGLPRLILPERLLLHLTDQYLQ